MFDRAPQDNNIRRAMDACLPDLENKPDFERSVLRQVRGEVKVKEVIGWICVGDDYYAGGCDRASGSLAMGTAGRAHERN